MLRHNYVYDDSYMYQEQLNTILCLCSTVLYLTSLHLARRMQNQPIYIRSDA
jgi:hypothetical protein